MYVLVTMVVNLCYVGSGLCQEQIIARDMPMYTCVMSQAIVADWKEKTIYSGPNWIVDRVQCAPGDYVIKVPA